MTLEQLLSPAVFEWTTEHEHLPDDQLLKEFDKWFVENEDLINESVKNNIDEKEANIQKIIHNDDNVESISKTEKIEENKSQSFSLSSLLPNNINTNETSI
mgnify:CR=1 FL=1